MEISELKDKQGGINIDLKIIWNNAKPVEMFGKQIQSVIVADANGKQGDPTAYLDLINNQITEFKQGDKIRVTNAYSKLIKNNKGQYRVTNAKKIELMEEK